MILLLLACTPEAPAPAPPEALAADAGPDRVVPVGAAVKLDGRGSVSAVSFSWDAGDGRSYASPDPVLIYSDPGNYTAILEVTAADGSTRTDTTRVVVHPRPAEVPPTNSSTLALNEGLVWGVVEDAGAVFIASAERVEYRDVCSTPVGVAAGAGVTVLCGGTEPSLHPPDGASLPLPARSQPTALISREESWIVALSALSQLAAVSQVGTVTPIASAVDPHSLVGLGQDVLAPRFRSGPDQGELYGLGEPLVLDYDPGPDTDTGNRGVPNLLTVAAAPDGRTLFVAGTLSNTARGLVRDGEAMTHDTTVRAFFSIVDREHGERVRRQFDDQGAVSVLAVHPVGNLVFIAFPSTHTVMVLDAFTGDIAGSILDAGRGIDGMLVSEDGSTLYINATLDREIRAYDVRDLTVLPPLLWSQRSVETDPLPAEILLGKQLFHESADDRIAEDGYISCATCHPGGDHDGQTWDFTDRGEGLRNTSSLLGRAGTGMGPVHWTGNFDEIQDFEHDIRGPFSGTGLMSDADFALADTPLGPPKAGLSADLDALAAYVTSLDQSLPSPHDPPSDGAVVFEASGCADCHPAPLFTDSALDVRHDVGTLSAESGQRLGGPLDGIDTPTLLGAWSSAPYLHDGSAATLLDAIAAHDSAPTGATELATLADYVRSL